MQAIVKVIEYHVPLEVLTNEQLAAESAEWTAEKIEAKTGIAQRRVATKQECASDLAVAATEKLLARGGRRLDQIDYLLLCT